MSDLDSSSAHREKGLLSPRLRYHELKRIIAELRFPEEKHLPPQSSEISGAQDLCYRLFSEEVSNQMADELGVSGQQIRIALNNALRWSVKEAHDE